MELWKVSQKKNLQHVFSEASLPFGLIEEVIEVAAECDENKTKRKEPKNTWRKRENDASQRIDTVSKVTRAAHPLVQTGQLRSFYQTGALAVFTFLARFACSFKQNISFQRRLRSCFG